jgi:hypothetical protein
MRGQESAGIWKHSILGDLLVAALTARTPGREYGPTADISRYHCENAGAAGMWTYLPDHRAPESNRMLCMS